MSDTIDRQAAIDALNVGAELLRRVLDDTDIVGVERAKYEWGLGLIESYISDMKEIPSAQPDLSEYSDKLWRNAYERGRTEAQDEIVRCKDCKRWRQQTNYQGAPLSFGFCESDDMWRSLYGETYEVSHIDTDDDFYCGYAERRTDE